MKSVRTKRAAATAINTQTKGGNDDVPRQPNERDESPQKHTQKPRAEIQQAAIDLKNGLVDTDLYGQRGVVKTDIKSRK